MSLHCGLQSRVTDIIVPDPVFRFLRNCARCNMKQLFRLFFKALRFVLEPMLLLWERVTAPVGVIRSEQAQRCVLYQFKTCPFCIRTRRAARRLALNIEQLDARHDIKVTCLRIEAWPGEVRWRYDWAAIIRHLGQRLAH